MSLGPCLGAHPLWSHARLFAWESRVTKIFKIIIRVGFTFKKLLKLKFYRGIIFHGSSGKNQQKPREPKHGPRLINHESCAEKSQINLHLNMKLLTYCNDIFFYYSTVLRYVSYFRGSHRRRCLGRVHDDHLGLSA